MDINVVNRETQALMDEMARAAFEPKTEETEQALGVRLPETATLQEQKTALALEKYEMAALEFEKNHSTDAAVCLNDAANEFSKNLVELRTEFKQNCSPEIEATMNKVIEALDTFMNQHPRGFSF